MSDAFVYLPAVTHSKDASVPPALNLDSTEAEERGKRFLSDGLSVLISCLFTGILLSQHRIPQQVCQLKKEVAAQCITVFFVWVWDIRELTVDRGENQQDLLAETVV